MKKIFLIVVISILTLSFISCKKEKTVEPTSNEPQHTPAWVDDTTRLVEFFWNIPSNGSVQYKKNNIVLSTNTISCQIGDTVEITISQPNPCPMCSIIKCGIKINGDTVDYASIGAQTYTIKRCMPLHWWVFK